jgi:hypothetical protein
MQAQASRCQCVHHLKHEVVAGESEQSCQLAGVGEKDIVANQLLVQICTPKTLPQHTGLHNFCLQPSTMDNHWMTTLIGLPNEDVPLAPYKAPFASFAMRLL